MARITLNHPLKYLMKKKCMKWKPSWTTGKEDEDTNTSSNGKDIRSLTHCGNRNMLSQMMVTRRHSTSFNITSKAAKMPVLFRTAEQAKLYWDLTNIADEIKKIIIDLEHITAELDKGRIPHSIPKQSFDPLFTIRKYLWYHPLRNAQSERIQRHAFSKLLLSPDKLHQILCEKDVSKHLAEVHGNHPITIVTLRYFLYVSQTIERLKKEINSLEEQQLMLFNKLIEAGIEDTMEPVVTQIR